MKAQALSHTEWTLTAAGPVVIGAVLGLGGIRGVQESGTLDAIYSAGLLPAILCGVAAAMVPALYIATSLTGSAPPAREVGLALVRGFRACGIAMLGLAAPTAFLISTTQSPDAAALLGALVIGTGAFAGLRVLFATLFAQVLEPVIVRLVFGFWALVALGIGARMYLQFMVG